MSAVITLFRGLSLPLQCAVVFLLGVALMHVAQALGFLLIVIAVVLWIVVALGIAHFKGTLPESLPPFVVRGLQIPTGRSVQASSSPPTGHISPQRRPSYPATQSAPFSPSVPDDREAEAMKEEMNKGEAIIAKIRGQARALRGIDGLFALGVLLNIVRNGPKGSLFSLEPMGPARELRQGAPPM